MRALIKLGSAAAFLAIAAAAGVPDLDRWQRQRQSGRILAEVSRQTAAAERLGFGGTPSFAVEGPATDGLEPLAFPQSPGELEEAVDRVR